MIDRSILTLRAAARVSGTTHETVRAWCVKYSIGRQLEGGRWIVSASGLRRVMKAKAALANLVPSGDI